MGEKIGQVLLKAIYIMNLKIPNVDDKLGLRPRKPPRRNLSISPVRIKKKQKNISGEKKNISSEEKKYLQWGKRYLHWGKKYLQWGKNLFTDQLWKELHFNPTIVTILWKLFSFFKVRSNNWESETGDSSSTCSRKAKVLSPTLKKNGQSISLFSGSKDGLLFKIGLKVLWRVGRPVVREAS